LRIIFQTENNIGKRKHELEKSVNGEWILLIDSDEVLSRELTKEIRETITNNPENIHGYEIPYQNYVFGKPVYFGGERYSKTRLFRRKYGTVTPEAVHEEVVVTGKIGKLKNPIHHYSYRSLPQVLSKFTRYAWQMAIKKHKSAEHVTLRKLFMYGPHMFWARYIKDQGWRDGWQGTVLAACFAYMESLMYWFLLWQNIVHRH